MSSVARRGSHSISDQDLELRKGPWTLEEDSHLIHSIACHGEGRWNMLAKLAGLKRTGKSCRLRWLNYLKPDIKRGNLSPQEQLVILDLHSKWGNRWSKIAQHLPGRTDNEIKNYWRTRVQKQARQMNIESGSQSFVDALRCFWMPRLLQKMEQCSSDASCSSSSMAMKSENQQDFPKLITSSNSVALTNLPPSLPPPMISSTTPLEYPHHEIASTGFSDLNVSCSDSMMNIWQPPDLAEWPTSPYEMNTDAVTYNSCFVDNNNVFEACDMVGLNFDPISSLETNLISQFGNHIADSDWVLDNMADSLWNMDAT